MSRINKILKNKVARSQLCYTAIILVFIRIVSQFPVPGVNVDVIQGYFSNDDVFNFLDTFTGGGMEKFSVFSLSIAPFITASIFVQISGIIFPFIEKLQKDGEVGRRKLNKYTQYIAVVVTLVEATAMAMGLSSKGLIEQGMLPEVIVVITLTAGSSILMWLANIITEKGVGNGISLILLLNVLSRVPKDLNFLYAQFIKGEMYKDAIVSAVVMVFIVAVVMILTILLNDAYRKIPIQYTGKLQGNRFCEESASHIPLKLNTGNVMPIIFATTLMATPGFFIGLLREPVGVGLKITHALNPNFWFNPTDLSLSIGYFVYIGLIAYFSYFYTNISFNPAEVSESLKKAGAIVPGVRQGKSTELYFKNVLRHLVAIGALGMIIICTVPLVANGLFSAKVTFGGTSLIIIVSVIIEMARKLDTLVIEDDCEVFLPK